MKLVTLLTVMGALLNPLAASELARPNEPRRKTWSFSDNFWSKRKVKVLSSRLLGAAHLQIVGHERIHPGQVGQREQAEKRLGEGALRFDGMMFPGNGVRE